MTRLDVNALPSLAARVTVPTYDLTRLRTGVVHFGVGGFHRAHQAMYLDRLLGTPGHEEWAICGVGVLNGDARMRDALAAQDHLYTLVTRAPDGTSSARVIGAVREYLFAPDDPESVVVKLADPATRIVSLTITEGGYLVNDATGEFDADAPDVRHDLMPGASPRTVFGFVTEGLRRRREAGVAPFTVVSCDNLQGNGHVARRALTAFARLRDAEFGEWVARHVAFPNSMVDRITPVTTDRTRQEVAGEFGVDDAWPVVAESFTQWVLEDRFTMGRPPLDTVGVQLVDDVEPYELMKLRLLNASHQAMGHLGLLAGYTLAHEVCQDALFVEFLLGYMEVEATPTLRPVPGLDLRAYREELIARFGNPAIADTLSRLVAEASDRVPKFVLPVVRDQLAAGGELRRCALIVAAWCAGVVAAHEGRAAPLVDARAALLTRAALRESECPGAFLEVEEVFGDLARQARFRGAFVDALDALRRLGPRGALRDVGRRGDALDVGVD